MEQNQREISVKNLRPVATGALFVFLASLHMVAPCAADDGKKLTDKQIEQMESSSVHFAESLIAAGVWKKSGGEYEMFNYYDAKATVDIAEYDLTKKEYTNEIIKKTGSSGE